MRRDWRSSTSLDSWSRPVRELLTNATSLTPRERMVSSTAYTNNKTTFYTTQPKDSAQFALGLRSVYAQNALSLRSDYARSSLVLRSDCGPFSYNVNPLVKENH